MKDTANFLTLVNSEIEKLKFGDEPANLYDPISYILSLGGKRLRPTLVLLGYNLFKRDFESVLRPALAVEVFHNFTLMHDDIMDEAPLRRGKPTVHEKWNSTVGILSGDTMLVKAYDLLLEVDDQYFKESVRLFNKTAVEVCEGQQIDMNFESRDDVSVSEYINMIRLKTAVLLGFSLQYGALLGGASEEERAHLYEVGVNMGLGFQLMDDLLDVYADQAKFGKQVGGDIVSNKKTFLLIEALELASDQQKVALNDWLNKREFDNAEKVQGVTAIYDELNIKELTTEKMNHYFDMAFEQIKALDVDKEALQLLRQFAGNLMRRDY
ncbi:MAG: geranylgeranyl diphosphate synthase type II [Cyclobacteriaceae bacterium]|jgi:geranylgeranyl diphosphate synthase type II